MPEPLPGMTPQNELTNLASTLHTIAEWEEFRRGGTNISAVFKRSAEWLKACSYKTCGQGYIGCRGGDTCDSDHK